jgi:hypothetical protein
MDRKTPIVVIGWEEGLAGQIDSWIEDVLSWPNIANGLFEVDSAINIFNQFFEARQPLAYQNNVPQKDKINNDRNDSKVE